MAHSGRLSSKQRAAIVALLSCGSVRDAAAVADIAERTLYRWLTLPAFRAELERAGDEAVSEAVRCLSDTARIAVLTLRGVLEDPRVSPAVRVRAAGVVLANVLGLRELVVLADRVSVLESAHGKNT